jgi:hypothetical protein
VQSLRILRHSLIAIGLSSLVLGGAAHAARVDLSGYSTTMTGKWKLSLEDGGARLGCDSVPTAMSAMFLANGTWVGTFGANGISGTWKQKGKGDRTVKIGLDEGTKLVLNQAIDDGVSSCILSIPDGLPVRFKKVAVKGKINKKGTKLVVKMTVEFRSRENGLFWDMRGDSRDVFKLKVKGGLTPPPPAPLTRGFVDPERVER